MAIENAVSYIQAKFSGMLSFIGKTFYFLKCHSTYSADGIFMPATKKVAGYYVIPSEILSVRQSIRTSASARNSYSFRYREYVPSARNSSYSFRLILSKLYRRV